MTGWAEHHDHAGLTFAELTRLPEVRDMVGECIAELNRRLNRWETIKRWAVLDRDLTVENGELTPSLKVKRRVVEDHFRDEIAELYA
jgi:long-chain acyl-CoA synthetase